MAEAFYMGGSETGHDLQAAARLSHHLQDVSSIRKGVILEQPAAKHLSELCPGKPCGLTGARAGCTV